MKHLIKSDLQYTVSTMSEADQLEQKMRQNGNYIVQAFEKKKKQITTREKIGGKTVLETEEFVLCNVRLIFNDLKNPIDDIDIEFKKGSFTPSFEQKI